MECDKIKMLLIDYIEDKVESSIKNEIEKHLISCTDCSKEFDELKIILTEIEHIDEPVPEMALKIGFEKILKAQKRRHLIFNLYNQYAKVAAAVLIFVTGYLFATLMQTNQKKDDFRANSQVEELASQLDKMKLVLMFSMLENNSPTERIKAVGYSEQLKETNNNMVNALINTTINDENVNVRLAALKALENNYDSPLVKSVLVKALETEKNPIMQIEIINVLVQTTEYSAITPFRKIIESDSCNDIVKNYAKNSMDYLIKKSEVTKL